MRESNENPLQGKMGKGFSEDIMREIVLEL